MKITSPPITMVVSLEAQDPAFIAMLKGPKGDKGDSVKGDPGKDCIAPSGAMLLWAEGKPPPTGWHKKEQTYPDWWKAMTGGLYFIEKD